MAVAEIHPSVEELVAFTLGTLEDETDASVGAHIASCASCQEQAANAPDDTFVELLRSVHTRTGFGTDAVAETAAQVQTPLVADQTVMVARGVAQPALAGSDCLKVPDALPAELVRHERYRVVRLLGTGGMGAVYEAEHRVMLRHVALKVIKRAYTASPATVERFRREVRAAARLSHPNVVATYDAEDAGDKLFLAMEYVEGINLARLVKQHGPLPVAEACDYVRQAALGLQHAHERGMVHRDVKPDNLMLVANQEPDAQAREKRVGSAPGVVKVLDFGLAALREEVGGVLTEENVVMGTPDFMAPEQAEDARTADIRADVYSLGCTLYYLLTGSVPYPAPTTISKIFAHREQPLPSIRQKRPDVPPELARVMARLLAKKPKDRYQTPGEAAAALAPFVAAKSQQVKRGSNRGWLVATAALFLGLLLAAGVVVYRIQTDQGELVITTENDDVEVAVKQGGKVVEIIDTKTNKRITLRSGVYDLELKGAPEGLKLDIDKATLTRDGTVLARIERVAKAAPEKVGEVRRFEGHKGTIRAVAVSPKGHYALTAGGWPNADGTLRLWDLDTGKEIWAKLADPKDPVGVAFSPDGLHAVSGGQSGELRLWDVKTGEILHVLRYDASPVYAVAFTPNGKYILSGGNSGWLRRWDVDTGKLVKEFDNAKGWIISIAVSPDGGRAVVGADGSSLWDLQEGTLLRRFEDKKASEAYVAFGPDGRCVLTGGTAKDNTAQLWDTETGKEIRQFVGHKRKLCSVAISPDGQRVLTGDWGGTICLWEVATGKELCRLENFQGWAQESNPNVARVHVAFSPDGNYAFSGGADGIGRLWRLPDWPAAKDTGRANIAPSLAKPERLHAIAWQDVEQGIPAHIFQTGVSADGKLFFGAGDSGSKGSIRIYEVVSGKLIQDLRPGGDVCASIAAFVPGGKYLAASYSLDKDLYLWDIAMGKIVRKLTGHTKPCPRLAVSPDGKRLLSWGDDPWTIRLWDIESGKELRKLEGHDKASGVFGLDGKTVLTFGPDKTPRIWGAESGKQLRKLEGHTDACTACSFSPDGQQVLSSSLDQTTRLWDVATGKEIRRFEGGNVHKDHPRVFVAGGRKVAGYCDDQKYRVWDTASGKVIREIDLANLGEDRWSMTASPDGRLALICLADGVVQVFDLASGKEIHRFQNCPRARAFSFTPDGNFAVAGSFRAGLFVFRLPNLPAAKAKP